MDTDNGATAMTRRIYPSWVKKPYTQNAHNLAETMGRIADRVEHWQREEEMKVKALAHCRAIAAEFRTQTTERPR